MRRATLCLLSTLAMTASLPALAQDPSHNQQAAPQSSPANAPIVTSSVPSPPPQDEPRPAQAVEEPPAQTETQPATEAQPAQDSGTPAAAPAAPETAAPAAPATPSESQPAATAAPAEPAAPIETPPPAAVTTPATPPAEPAPALAAPVPPSPPPLQTALLRAIETSQPSARQAMERDWHQAIAAFYAAREGKPVWMSDAGMTPAAEALTAEIARADEWGLDPGAFDVAVSRSTDPDQIAADELKLTRALLTYAWHARGGRLDPSQLSKWLDQSPRPIDAKAVIERFAASSDPSVDLQKLHPQHRQFELLRRAYLKARAGTPEKPQVEEIDPRDVTIPNGPVVRLGSRHEHVELVRRRLEVPASNPDDADLYDEDVAAAVREFLGATYRTRDGRTVRRAAHPDLTNFARSRMSRSTKKAQPARSREPTLKQYLVNLERWRWMPETLGSTHVWNNLPEYATRVIRNDKLVHQERIIIGKPTNQTPVFSDSMQFVVFHPDWGVPNTIKVQDLLPSLQAGDDSVLRRRNMRLVNGNRTVHPSEIDWSRTDIRRMAVIQDPGPSNPLGRLKFMFPNKHDVYMHDTPTKNLFETPVRAYSFGCIRVRNPVRLAELVFNIDRNWSQTDVDPLLTPRAQQNNRVDLNRRIPVHNTYFTLLADEDGKVTSFADVYGHDKRIQAVLLDGQRVDVVARTDPAAALDRKVRELAAAPPRPARREVESGWSGWGWGAPQGKRGGGGGDFFSGLFGN